MPPYYQVIPAEADLEIRGGSLKTEKKPNTLPDPTASSFERVHIDAAGLVQLKPVTTSGPYKVTIGYNKVTVTIEFYVKPYLRDWILVGFGEGTVGYNTITKNMESLSGQADNLYTDGRLALFSKGTIKGEWLLTVAYDSAKTQPNVGNGLFQTIDPNSYYTLYGDASTQKYDASSAKKLYLKIERDQFYALFGDFDTNLTLTELSKYTRRLTGAKVEYQSKYFEANVFGAETPQAYVKDEIRGDGTSGLYRLSRKNIMLNSEKVTIEVRDRFRSEIIVSSQAMSRSANYTIDYVSGTLFFNEPIFSRDENFNPVYIVVEYEVLTTGANAITAGGRVGVKLPDPNIRAGVTYIHEGQDRSSSNLYGADLMYKITPELTLRGEVARTKSDVGGKEREGDAYLAELAQNSKNFIAKLYFRQQDKDFGLGQLNGSETGTRKYGVDAAYKFTPQITISGQAYRQYNLTTSAVQDIAEAKVTSTIGPYSSSLGLRYASDKLGDGTVNTSEQLTMGASWTTLNKRLTLKADHDQSFGGDNKNASFPTRTTLGVNLLLTKAVTLFLQQELTYSTTTANTNTTRFGVKSTPWTGGTVNSSMERSVTDNGDRLFALFGLKQAWKITDKWSVSAGLDRSQPIAESGFYQFNPNTPPASGAVSNTQPVTGESFTAISLGSAYKEKTWSWNSRIEARTSRTEDKWSVQTAYIGEADGRWGWSSRLQLYETKTASSGAIHTNGDLRLGLVYRPQISQWIVLDRLDFIYDKQTGTALSATDSRRVVNNLNLNFKPNKKLQFSLMYGAKYSLGQIDGTAYTGFTDTIGIDGRYDITSTCDLGLRGSVLHSWASGQLRYSAGPAVGVSVVKNTWISLGYNVIGFTDKDFSAANYTAQGPYVQFRFKFDQKSVRDAITWVTNN